MNAALLQLAEPMTDDWVRSDEAARLCGESERHWRRRAEWECKLARQQGRVALARKAVPAEGGKPAWFVHRSLDRRLTPFPKSSDLWVCDHHQLDLWCEHNGEQLRPWLTAIQDCRSRAIVGWELGVAPHQDLILAAMRRAFTEWAIPRHMRIDNGRDYTSKPLTGYAKAQRDRLRAELGTDWHRAVKADKDRVTCDEPQFQGVIHELGIELIYAIPYSPWSKGTLERWFGTLEQEVGQSFATYCGRSALHRPECLEDIRRGYTKERKRTLRKRYGREWKKVAVLKFVDQSAVPTLEQVSAAIGEWIEVYHGTEHRGEGMNGRTPLAVWNEATTLRQAQKDELLLLLQSRGVYKVGRNGVHFKVGGATVSYGATCTALYRLKGRDVHITQDPDDLSYCVAWTAGESRRFIARLEANERISPPATADELRRAFTEVQRRRKIGRRADREAVARRRSVAQELTAARREKLAELRATGTEGPRVVNVEPVRTGFEVTSIPGRRASESASADYTDAMKRLVAFNARPEPEAPKTESTWERLKRFNRGGLAEPQAIAGDVSDILSPEEDESAERDLRQTVILFAFTIS